MKNSFDVIIIGAGPAGLKCAHQLKNSKLSVLLLEKNGIIGPKVCAGGLTQLNDNFDFPEEKMRNFRELVIYFKNKAYRTSLVKPIKTINRYDLGQHLLSKIEDSDNITILKRAFVKRIKKNSIITSKGEFLYKYLVGADGSNSLVRSYLNLKTEITVGLRYKVAQKADDLASYFDPKLLGYGYIWIFPHKDNTNIGIYFDSQKISSKRAKQVLQDFLKKNNFAYSEDNFGAAPLNSDYKGCLFGNVFLIGGAAGLTSKLTGEGISLAIVSGQEIGKKILDSNYEMPFLKKVLTVKKRQRRTEQVFSAFPFFQNIFFRIFIRFLENHRFQSYFFG